MTTNEESISAPPVQKRQRWNSQPKLGPEAANRQGLVTRFALETLGGKDAAIAYLNDDCTFLGGRPLDIAIGSAEGFNRVLHDLTARHGTFCRP